MSVSPSGLPPPSGKKAGASASDPSVTEREGKGKAKAKPGEIEEIGGPKGPEPTRYGDWEKGGRCSDF